MKSKKTYYLAVNKQTHEAMFATTISAIADMLGICRQSVSKYLSNANIYDTEGYTLWRDMKITKCRRRVVRNRE